jgi:hypothetical protein
MPPRKKSQNISGLRNQGTIAHVTAKTTQLTTQLMTQTIPTLRTYRDSLKIDWSLQVHSDNDSDWESELEEEIEADENLDDEEVTEILHFLLREAAEPGAQDPVKNQVSMLERLVVDITLHQETNTKLFYFSAFSDPRVETHVALLITKQQMWLKCLLRTSHISLMNDRVQ